MRLAGLHFAFCGVCVHACMRACMLLCRGQSKMLSVFYFLPYYLETRSQ